MLTITLRCFFNFIKKSLQISFLFFIQFLSSCSQFPVDDKVKYDAAKLFIKSLKPQVETIFNEAAPISPAERSSYPLVKTIPGTEFNAAGKVNRKLVYDTNGNLLLSSGDYVIPVMTYCMKQEGSSPSGHIYSLSKLEGTRAMMIRELNLLGSPKFNVNDIQIVAWSLQAGLAYDEMTKESQKIINEVIPQYKSQLKESFLSIIEKEWNKISDNSHGVISSFKESSENLLKELGNVGQKIIEIRRFKARLDEVGNDYSRLSELINTTSAITKKEISETSWAQISNNVYARFVTDGHFQKIGFIQIRIFKEDQKRVINSISTSGVIFDLASLIANPNSDSIQPLSFSPIYGYAGVMILPALVDNPLAATMVLAAILSAKAIDWDSFLQILNILKDSSFPQVRREIENGMRALQEAHDELEKPLREDGIINAKTKETTKNKKNKVREYEKAGGDKELQKDFDKLPGKTSIAEDGTEVKIISSDSKAIKRQGEVDKPPTLEIQPLKSSSHFENNLRVKVRYK